MAGLLKIGKKTRVAGKNVTIKRATQKGKTKQACTTSGKCVPFGAKGASVKPGTPKGDSYCARSAKITSKQKGLSPNDLARADWGCKGAKSRKSR